MGETFDSLKQRISDYRENPSQKFVDQTADFIDKAEQRISREMDVPGYAHHQFATLVANRAFLTRPPTAITIKYLSITDAQGKQHPVVKRTVEFLNTFWPNRTASGSDDLVRYYAEFNETDFLLAPAPGAALAIESGYRERVTPLSDSNPTNILSNYFPDFLFAACMIYAEAFDENFSNQGPQSWEQIYQTLKAGAVRDAARYHVDEFQAGPSVV